MRGALAAILNSEVTTLRCSRAADWYLRELGLEHEELFGPEVPFSEPPGPGVVSQACEPLSGSYEFDCIELFSGQGNWSAAHSRVGLRVHPWF